MADYMTTMSEKMTEFSAALTLSREKGVGAAMFRMLVDRFLTPGHALKYWLDQKQHSESKCRHRKSPATNLVELAIRGVGAGRFSGFYYSQPGYPLQLNDLSEPPPVIFVSGLIPEARFAAVVGARKCDAVAAEVARLVTRKLVASGYAIISGGAAGIDAVAHQTAIEENGKTVAVLATGIDVVYPKSNLALFDKIRTAGALMTELMPTAKPMKSFFPTRNRIIAAMADIVVVVQAKSGSGSLITAKWAEKLGRKLFAVMPPAGNHADWLGNKFLIDRNSGIIVADNSGGILFVESQNNRV
jgi:DNA protecting protein DprA